MENGAAPSSMSGSPHVGRRALHPAWTVVSGLLPPGVAMAPVQRHASRVLTAVLLAAVAATTTACSGLRAVEFGRAAGYDFRDRTTGLVIVVDGEVYHHVRIDRIRIGSSSGTSLIGGNTDGGAELSDKTGQILAKAGWNWFLFHSDGSAGAHHPSFTLEALDAAIEKLEGVLGVHED